MRSLVLIGHGSHTQAESARAVHQLAEGLRAQGHFAEVIEGYWQEEPSLRQVLKTVQFTDVTVVPLFMPKGHLTETVLPRELGLGHQGPVPEQGITRVIGGRTVRYTPPIDDLSLVAYPDMAQVIIYQLAQKVRGGATMGGDLDHHYQSTWATFMQLAKQGTLRLGEAIITAQAGLFELRHALDEGRSNETLTTYVTLSGLWERVRHDEAGQFRPLRSLRNLPRGWRAVVSGCELPRAVQYLYPAAVEESMAHHNHALRSTPWAATARRQADLSPAVFQATAAQIDSAVASLCSHCLKTPIWAAQPLLQTFVAGVPGGLPCAEACTLVVARVEAEAGA